MFKIIPAPLVWWPVTFPGVTEEGVVIENKFEMRFRIMGEDEHVQFLLDVAKEDEVAVNDAVMTAPSATAAKVVKRVAVDWRSVAAENGELLKFDDEHLCQLLNIPNVFTGIMKAYRDCRAGHAAIRSGN